MLNAIQPLDAKLADAKANSDYSAMTHTKALIRAEITLDGFDQNNYCGLCRHAEGPEDINASRKLVRATAKEMGYKPAGKAKMMGGSETLENFKHPAMPNHKLQMHQKPRVRGGVRESTIILTVEMVH